nr:SP24 family structural protein [Whitefly negevirus 1]
MIALRRRNVAPRFAKTPTPAPRNYMPRPKPRPAVRVVKKNNQKRSMYDLDLAFSDISRAIMSSINRPFFMLILAFTAVVVYSHKDIFDQGIFAQWLLARKGNAFVDWVLANKQKFLGGVLFIPAIIDIPARHRAVMVIASIGWVYFMPPVKVIEYFIHALSTTLYFRVQRTPARILIVACVLLAYAGGYLTTSFAPTPTSVHTNTLRTSMDQILGDRRKRSLREILQFAESPSATGTSKSPP